MDSLAEKILTHSAIMAAPSVLEAHMVLSKYLGSETGSILNARLSELGVSIIAFTPSHADLAADAFDRYGKGRHPAALNFGDCIAYALSKSAGVPLLFVGQDFSKTDVLVA